jgi:hypothetical protein
MGLKRKQLNRNFEIEQAILLEAKSSVNLKKSEPAFLKAQARNLY